MRGLYYEWITNEKDVDRLTAIGIEVKKIISDSKLLENKLVKKDSILADIISQMKENSQGCYHHDDCKKLLHNSILF